MNIDGEEEGMRSPRGNNGGVLSSKHNKARTVLRGINVTISPGEKVALMGREGSGRKQLFLSIIGEIFMEKGRGSMQTHGKIGYVDGNNLFFIHSSIKNNIIMDLGSFDQVRF